MHTNSTGERIQQVRGHFKLSRKELIQIVKVNLSTISRIESDLQKPSDIFLDALMAKLLVNPDWVKTGNGDMLITPEEYIKKGIDILGIAMFGKGLVEILKVQEFSELKSLFTVFKMTGDLDPQLMAYLQYLIDKWRQGDENIRGWLKIQMDSVAKH